MHIDPSTDTAMISAARRAARGTPWIPLLSAMLELGGGKGELLRHSEQSWASVTISGTRHSVVLAFTGVETVAAGEAYIEALPDHEFAIPRQLVADAAVVAVDHTALPEPRLKVTADLLPEEEG